jgi:cysteine desulfurase/selenocysteine lyase
MINVRHVRKETPGCKNVIHFNNAGASLMPQPVVEAVSSYFQLEAQQGGYEAAIMEEVKIRNFYHAASSLLGCQSSEVAFIESATRAWDMVFYSINLKAGDKILTTISEYGSNYIAFLHLAKRKGVIIEVIPNDTYGQLCLKELKNKLDQHVKLIAITHIPMHGGLINPVEEVGKIAQEANIFYLLDATQSIGQLPVNVKEMGCDALCATGRKYLRGPRGTGFLYINQKVVETLDPPFLDLHAACWVDEKNYQIQPDARRFETWEANYSNKVGLGVAIDYALQLGMDNIWKRICHLAQFLRNNLLQLSGITIHDMGERKSGLVTFTARDLSVYDIYLKLKGKKINVSICLAEDVRMDMKARELPCLIRASVHYYNTEEEIERFCQELMRIFDRKIF